jgi:hypothetical protein
MDKFLNTYTPQRLNYEEEKNLSKPIMRKEKTVHTKEKSSAGLLQC